MAQTTYGQTWDAFQNLNSPTHAPFKPLPERHDYHHAYKSAYHTFLDVLEEPVKPSLKEFPIDNSLRRILLQMTDKIGKKDYIKKLLKAHFNEKNVNPEQAQAAFHSFLDAVLRDFVDTQSYAFKQKGFSLNETDKQHFLARWKRLINQFAHKHHLSKRICWRPQLNIQAEVCDNLFSQLQNHIQNQQSYFDQLDVKPGNSKGRFITHANAYNLRLQELQKKKTYLEWLKKQLKESYIDFDNLLLYFQDDAAIVAALKKIRQKLSKKHMDELNKLIKAYKKRLVLDFKALRHSLESTLDETFLPYTLQEKLYDTVNVDETFREYKETTRKVKDWGVKPTSKMAATVLAITQASITFFAGLFYFPLIGGAAIPFSILLFLLALVINYTGFNVVSQEVLKLLYIKGDIWVGFKSLSGKALVGVMWVLAITIGIALTVVTGLTIHTALIALATLVPLLAPIALGALPYILVPVCAVSLICFVIFFFISIATAVNEIYSWIEKHCPEIAHNGGGIIQFLKGVSIGLGRFYQATKIHGSFLFGVAYKVEVGIKQLWRYYWSNPTGLVNDPDGQKVWCARLSHITGTILKAVLLTLAVGFIALGGWIIFNAWHVELSTFIFGVAHLADVGVAYAFVSAFACTAVIKGALTFKNYFRAFSLVAQISNRVVEKLLIYPTTVFFSSPRRFWNEIVVAGINSGARHTKEFFREFAHSPKRTLIRTLKALGVAIYAFFMVGNVVAHGVVVLNGAFVSPNISVNGIFQSASNEELSNVVDNPPQKYIYTGAYAKTAICTPTESNSDEAKLAELIPVTEVPLNQLRDQVSAETSTSFGPFWNEYPQPDPITQPASYYDPYNDQPQEVIYPYYSF
jgi:hypothetical protein